MTTVGYGDKTPKSIPARLFSIVWIMIGVMTFSLLTGQLTGEIMKANSQPQPSMKDKLVGVKFDFTPDFRLFFTFANFAKRSRRKNCITFEPLIGLRSKFSNFDKPRQNQSYQETYHEIVEIPRPE